MLKMKSSIKDFFSKYNLIRSFLHSFLRIWSNLLKKSLMENFIFCAVIIHIQPELELMLREGMFDLAPTLF